MSGGFADLGLLPELLHAIDDQGWLLPTDIQDEAIPLILGGGDVMGAAETGSGKTAAFALPIIQVVYERLKTTNTKSTHSSATATVRLNAIDRDAEMQLSADQLTACYPQGDKWVGVRSTHGIKSGKAYYEVLVTGPCTNCRVGWSTRLGHLDLGKDRLGYGYGAKGFKSHNGEYEKYAEPYSSGDVIGCLLDLQGAQSTARFSKNGLLHDIAYSISPDSLGGVFFPTIALSGASVEVNFGQKPFRHLPLGYAAMSSLQLIAADSNEAFATHKRKPLALIIEPTRDLAEQVYESFVNLSAHLQTPRLRCLLMIGDDRRTNTQRELADGVDIVIGTLGKLTASIANGQLDLSQIRFFVLDEADRMTAADNLTTVKEIFAHCPTAGTGVNRLQVCFFSATLHDPAIKALAEVICLQPTWIDLKGTEVVPDTLHHTIYRVFTGSHKQWVAGAVACDEVHLPAEAADPACLHSQQIKEIKPFLLKAIIDKYDMSQVMVFCRTNVDCSNLERFFTSQSPSSLLRKYSCAVLGGMMSMNDRRKNLQLFKDGEVKILICTDVAARGIDVDSLPYVINMTLPEEPEDYIHRVGRVGRADRMGLAISLVAESREKVWYHTCSSKGRGSDCTNRKLKDQGGCTIWQDEQLMLAKIEKKLNKRIAVMDTVTLDLPEELKVLNTKYGETATQSVLHGESKVYMTERMIGTVKTLTALETEAQNIFLSMHNLGRYGVEKVSGEEDMVIE